MINIILPSIIFSIIGIAFMYIGLLLISDCRNKLDVYKPAPGTFDHFHYLFGVGLGIADIAVALAAFVTAVLVIIYPIF